MRNQQFPWSDPPTLNVTIAVILTGILVFILVRPGYSGGIKDKIFCDAICDEITSIYDGDTFRCNIKDFPSIAGYRIMIRIDRIDTPELRDNRPRVKELARAAKRLTVEKLRRANVVELKNMKRGKYFRIIADLYVDGENLGKELIDKGVAKPYNGGKKIRW